MAIDPSIILGGHEPTVQPPSLTGAFDTIAKIEDINAQRAQRDAIAENTRQMALRRIQDAKDQAAINAAVQSANGDLDGAADALDKSGSSNAASLLRTRTAEARKKAADALDAQNKATASQSTLGLNLLNGSVDDQSQQTIETMLSAMNPQVAQLVKSLPANLTWDQRRDALRQVGLTAKEGTDRTDKALEAYRKGELDTALGWYLSASPNAEAWQQTLDSAAHMGIPQATIDRYRALGGFSPENAAQAQQMALSPEQRVQEANTAADNARQDAQAAETARHNRAEEGIQRANAGGGGAASGAPSDAVLSYVAQLKTGGAKLTDVPAAGGMRNAVMAQLKKEGFDLTQPITSQTRSMAEMARSLQPNITKVEQLARQMKAAGLAGTLGGRLREWASGESSAASLAGLTAEQRRLVGQFTTEAGLLKSGVARAHGGARGGGSISMLESLNPLLDPGNKDLDTYLGNLAGAKDFIDGYATMDKPASSAPASTPKPAYTYDPTTGTLKKAG